MPPVDCVHLEADKLLVQVGVVGQGFAGAGRGPMLGTGTLSGSLSLAWP